jgi:hypothetical protein
MMLPHQHRSLGNGSMLFGNYGFTVTVFTCGHEITSSDSDDVSATLCCVLIKSK